jgi:hypothetical protein
MERMIKIRTSEACGISVGLFLLGGGLFPMSTPRSLVAIYSAVICFLGLGALYFSSRERKSGESQRSLGFFAFAVLATLIGLLSFLTVVL